MPLLNALRNELNEIEAFVHMLEQEQQALIANTLADLIEFAKSKAARAQQLELMARERKRLFEANGVTLSPEPPHPIVAVRYLPPEAIPELGEIWQKLLQSARQASALNQTNGRLIDMRQQQNQQLMALLQANSAHGSVLSYDAYGQARISKAGGSLGKA